MLLIEPDVFGDERGYFLETYNVEKYRGADIDCEFVQSNLSFSRHGILRGLHLQNPSLQDKLVSVPSGKVFDVAVDVRGGSPTFGKWIGEILSGENNRQLFIPKGFAHGFCVLSETVHFSYQCSDHYEPSREITILWNDPDVGIDWPLDDPVLTQRDADAPLLREIDPGRLPVYLQY